MQKTKKELGQHWLTDDFTLQAICDEAGITKDDHVLEIGPGTGLLTQKLLNTGAKITAVELDEILIPSLRDRFKKYDSFELFQTSIIDFDLRQMTKGYKIVANIPYYLTSHLIRIISEASNPPSIAVLLVQKEVAERICADQGSMSLLSVTAQFYFDCSVGVIVPAKMFVPPPKVDSQVVILRRHPGRLFDVKDDEFFRLVKAGFAGRRKTLRNSLSAGMHLSKDEIVELLQKASIDSTKRAQTLSLDDWYRLYKVLD